MTGAGSAPAHWRGVLGHRGSGFLFRLLYRAEAHGAEHVPASGPVLLAPNHIGYLDGALVLAMAPRPSHMLVLESTFAGAVGRLLHLVGEIPIDQLVGDRKALGAALAVLGRGGVIGIFPEGGRGRGDLANAGKGVAWLAVQGKATVVPVACLGTRYTGRLAAWWPPLRSRLVVDFGPPVALDIPDGMPGRRRLDFVAEQVRVALATHVASASEVHGIPLPTDVPPDLVR